MDNQEFKWRKDRLGKFTASQVYRLMTYPNKKDLSKGGMTYSQEKAMELYYLNNCTDEQLITFFERINSSSRSTDHGCHFEPLAIMKYEEEKQCFVLPSNFISKDQYGATPDGILENKIVEVKSPYNPIIFFGYCGIKNGDDLKKFKPENYWQIQLQLLVTEKEVCDLVVYDSSLDKINITEICINEKDVLYLKDRIDIAIKHRDYYLSNIVDL